MAAVRARRKRKHSPARPEYAGARPPRRRAALPEPVTDPAEAAQSAGLRYVSDTTPGIRRKRSGPGFFYVGPEGQRIRDAATLGRIKALAIPPAWTDVWICPSGNGHLQATGRDTRGRKQYRYHAKWREVRDETKFSRMLAFSEALPAIRRRVEEDIKLPGLPKDKVLAAVVKLLECTGIRVGNDEYARDNGSYGLTTLRDQHVKVEGARLRFSFKGKSGIRHAVDLSDRRLAGIVLHCQSLPGEELFQYLGEEGGPQDVTSGDVNDYLRRITGEEFTAKDFRTWAGTVLAVNAFKEIGPPSTARESKGNAVRAIDRVAERLRNTRSVCKKYYIHPAVLEAYADGSLAAAFERLEEAGGVNGRGRGRDGTTASGFEPEERVVVGVLRERANLADGPEAA